MFALEVTWKLDISSPIWHFPHNAPQTDQSYWQQLNEHQRIQINT